MYAATLSLLIKKPGTQTGETTLNKQDVAG